ncbi:hypothetical protein QTH97_22790 [Variovorax sp. J22R24]|uniref:hypothetical protein n=1 Tax=Variovorax gracilis TaxID=3053502 RepID=UPI002574B902|nr:hypothetical protein [Variovorax sp. J22R24]MDM0107791.1 hypothetical protein [Variovorax sp. J22R24]
MATRNRTEAAEPRQRRRPPPRLKPLGKDDQIVTKAELIRLLGPCWPTVAADLSHPSRNGLRVAAGALTMGTYWAGRAQHWAQSNGRWKERTAPVSFVFAQHIA